MCILLCMAYAPIDVEGPNELVVVNKNNSDSILAKSYYIDAGLHILPINEYIAPRTIISCSEHKIDLRHIHFYCFKNINIKVMGNKIIMTNDGNTRRYIAKIYYY